MTRYIYKITFCLFMIPFLFTSCRKEKTNWNSDWVFPLIKDSLQIKDYVNDSTLAVNSDESIQVIFNRHLVNLDLSDLVTIPDTSISEIFTISIPSLEVAPGFSFMDDNIKEFSFNLNDVALLEGRIKQGNCKIQIENPVPTTAIFSISLPGVLKDGEVFSITREVQGGTAAQPGVGDINFDLSGAMIDMRGINQSRYNILQAQLNVKSSLDGDTVTVTNQDKFNTKISFTGLTVDYAKGYFGNTVFNDTIERNIPELNKIVGGGIEVDEINLELFIENGVKATAQGKISLFESYNQKTHHTERLIHPYFGQTFNINAADGQWTSLTPSELAFTFDNASDNSIDFIENLGSMYKIGYAIEINPFGSSGGGHNAIYPQSKIGLGLRANFPLRVGVNDLILQDTFEIDFKNDNKLLQIESGEFLLKTTNSFPYGAEIQLTLLDKNHVPLKTLLSTGKISPALTNSTFDGHVPVTEELSYIIDKEAALLLPETGSILVKASFSSTETTNNVVYSNASIRFTLMSQLKIKTSL